jgi:hypothetical protein
MEGQKLTEISLDLLAMAKFRTLNIKKITKYLENILKLTVEQLQNLSVFILN